MRREADMNAQNKGGETTLHLAIQKGHKDIVQLLVDQGVDVNVKNECDDTPLHFAVRVKQEEICRLLLARKRS